MRFGINFFPSFRPEDCSTADYYDQCLRLAVDLIEGDIEGSVVQVSLHDHIVVMVLSDDGIDKAPVPIVAHRPA